MSIPRSYGWSHNLNIDFLFSVTMSQWVDVCRIVSIYNNFRLSAQRCPLDKYTFNGIFYLVPEGCSQRAAITLLSLMDWLLLFMMYIGLRWNPYLLVWYGNLQWTVGVCGIGYMTLLESDGWGVLSMVQTIVHHLELFRERACLMLECIHYSWVLPQSQ